VKGTASVYQLALPIDFGLAEVPKRRCTRAVVDVAALVTAHGLDADVKPEG
jgi:hypothetical protein